MQRIPRGRIPGWVPSVPFFTVALYCKIRKIPIKTGKFLVSARLKTVNFTGIRAKRAGTARHGGEQSDYLDLKGQHEQWHFAN
jgi:hypothetical protein